MQCSYYWLVAGRECKLSECKVTATRSLIDVTRGVIPGKAKCKGSHLEISRRVNRGDMDVENATFPKLTRRRCAQHIDRANVNM